MCRVKEGGDDEQRALSVERAARAQPRERERASSRLSALLVMSV